MLPPSKHPLRLSPTRGLLAAHRATPYPRAMMQPADMTLDELRQAIAPLLPGQAAFDGWSGKALDAAAPLLGIPAPRARLAFPGGGADMIDAWFASIDRGMAERPGAAELSAMSIRGRITALIEARIDQMASDREALRRALTLLALPRNAAVAARLAWRTVDGMWRLAGDKATGFAHYSKRLTLIGVYGATLLVMLDDESEGLADTRAFLARRIADVMRFEKFKARVKPDRDRHFSPARFLGRLRYPVS